MLLHDRARLCVHYGACLFWWQYADLMCLMGSPPSPATFFNAVILDSPTVVSPFL